MLEGSGPALSVIASTLSTCNHSGLYLSRYFRNARNLTTCGNFVGLIVCSELLQLHQTLVLLAMPGGGPDMVSGLVTCSQCLGVTPAW